MAEGGQQALTQAATAVPDAVVLDVGMPDIDGLEVCRRLRGAGNRVPILMLTARDAVADRIDGLDAGADDYLVKPFDVGELKARLRALLRRSNGEGDPDALSFAELKLDSARHGVAVEDRFAELTRTEYQLLELLMLNPRRVLPHGLIYDRVWGYDFGPASNALRVYVGYLRRKLEDAGARAADPHDPRRRLRAARAMTLRTRMAAVAGIAVAVDRGRRWPRPSTRPRARRCAARSTRRCASAPHPIEHWRRGARDGEAAGRGAATIAARCATANPLRRRRRAGAVRLARRARVARPADATRRCPSTRARARLARERRRAATSATRTCSGVHLRVLTSGSAAAAPCRSRGRSTEVDHALRQLLLVLLAVGGGRHPARGRARRRRGACGARPGLALHPPHRGADRQSRPLAAPGDRGRGRARAPGAQLQRDARCARAVGRGAAAPRGRREPRAAHADRQPARQHPGARRTPTGCPRTSARACAPTSSRSSTS